MYTDSIEKEIDFISLLWGSHDTKMADGQIVDVCACPNCHKGTVKTRCTHGVENGNLHSWEFDHYCDLCGEVFRLDRIQSDIFFHKPYKTIEKLETPFGDIKVTVNGEVVPFRYRIESYEDPEDITAPVVTMHVIDIDLSQLKPDDKIFCGFDYDILEYNDGDERSILYSCENDKQFLGLCAYEPHEWELDRCCFQLEDYMSKGFGYRIIVDSKQFDEKEHYQSKIISLAVSWIDKEDYKDADLITFLALTSVIE